jgi:hypothetical protein
MNDIRKMTLWGNLMAGGAGVEYYFGYQLEENDLVAEDFRSRDKSWDYCRFALAFFRDNKIPFWQMRGADALVGNPESSNEKFAFVKPGEIYVVYLPNGGESQLDLTGASGAFKVQWYNPRSGGRLSGGSVKQVRGGAKVDLGLPPAENSEDWVALVRR